MCDWLGFGHNEPQNDVIMVVTDHVIAEVSKPWIKLSKHAESILPLSLMERETSDRPVILRPS